MCVRARARACACERVRLYKLSTPVPDTHEMESPPFAVEKSCFQLTILKMPARLVPPGVCDLAENAHWGAGPCAKMRHLVYARV